ncbi:hypothetical protein POREN0001_1279 [Porphyromonas endodontalis ATCC 35406]|uniref:Uncharacterized protein n=1 Tax=Porphyromonas endodontalis (strain ATCC 35406 / DSM 24491 / JCM 8526 / CCUG 16442 / BCRC 14492 / NCTC 13058 / HG 370) TaxID=553175 RepID=C3J836_POREA|nr:hypothetical protein POREN0001_1279 [Porphyromonas endodontalis ATCC 35406]
MKFKKTQGNEKNKSSFPFSMLFHFISLRYQKNIERDG